jgi:hypothetical protein
MDTAHGTPRAICCLLLLFPIFATACCRCGERWEVEKVPINDEGYVVILAEQDKNCNRPPAFYFSYYRNGQLRADCEFLGPARHGEFHVLRLEGGDLVAIVQEPDLHLVNIVIDLRTNEHWPCHAVRNKGIDEAYEYAQKFAERIRNATGDNRYELGR